MEDYLKISHLIQNDHQQINKLYQNYSISRGNIDDQQRWSNQIQQQLMAYLNTEETILYPFILQHFQLNIDLFIQQHQQMKKLLYFLHTTPITDPQYQWTFDQLIKAFNKHIIKEEEMLIPKLENNLSEDLIKSLSNSFEKTQRQNERKAYASSPINTPL